MKFFNFFRKERINPWELIEKLCEAHGEENLKVLNSCEDEDFKLTLLREFNSTNLKPEFKDFEDAVEKTRKVIEASNRHLKAPIDKEALDFYCK